MKTATASAFLWSFLKSCAPSHLFSSSVFPRRERLMKFQEDPDCFRLLIPESLVKATRQGNTWTLITALWKRGSWCLKKAVNQLNLPYAKSDDTTVEALAPTLQLTCTASSNGATQSVTTREHYLQKKMVKLNEGGCSQKA